MKPNKDSTIKTTITALSHDSRGISRCEGKTVFVSGALPGEQVLFKYSKKRGSFDEGIATQILSTSELRTEPKCQHFGVCGGCALQHLHNDAQIHHKQTVLLELLKHQAHAEPKEILPPLTGNIWGYRHRARLGVRFVPGKNKVLVGFREKNSRYLADLSRCEVLHPSIGHHLTTLSDLLYQLDTRAHIAQIEVATDDTVTALIFRHLVDLPPHDIVLLQQFAQHTGFKLYLQPKGLESIHPLFSEQNATLQYQLSDYSLRLNFHPSQFTQVNPSLNAKMITQALTLLNLTLNDTVLDLFCGIGNFTLPIATRCKQVVGVEGDASAILQAQSNSQNNRLTNCQFFTANLFTPPFAAHWAKQKYDKILVDPPRAGAKQVIESEILQQVQVLVYVSCNPATLARDTQLLIKQGFSLEKVGVMDMFPHTQHLEAIALFHKR